MTESLPVETTRGNRTFFVTDGCPPDESLRPRVGGLADCGKAATGAQGPAPARPPRPAPRLTHPNQQRCKIADIGCATKPHCALMVFIRPSRQTKPRRAHGQGHQISLRSLTEHLGKHGRLPLKPGSVKQWRETQALKFRRQGKAGELCDRRSAGRNPRVVRQRQSSRGIDKPA